MPNAVEKSTLAETPCILLDLLIQPEIRRGEAGWVSFYSGALYVPSSPLRTGQFYSGGSCRPELAAHATIRLPPRGSPATPGVEHAASGFLEFGLPVNRMTLPMRQQNLPLGFLCLALCCLLGSCSTAPSCAAGECQGTSGACLSCSGGSSCSAQAVGSCSTPNDGIYCCSGGGGGGGGGTTAYCSTGFCYSYLERICCPRSAPYACHGSCYTYSGGGGCADYRTTCY